MIDNIVYIVEIIEIPDSADIPDIVEREVFSTFREAYHWGRDNSHFKNTRYRILRGKVTSAEIL